MKFAGLSALGQRTSPPPISWLMQEALARPNLISLAAGFTDSASLPVAETRRLLQRILTDPKVAQRSLQYGSTAGDPSLRKLTAERLRIADGAAASVGSPADADRILITHGSQQFLYLVTECLCDPGDIVLVEDPTYFVYLSILQSHGIQARGVPLQPDGLDIAGLEQVLERLKQQSQLHRVKMLYLVSYFQNPSGVTTSFAKKQAALAILKRYEKEAGHPIYLLEDAAYRELRFRGEDVPSALRLSPERVIYAGTYSKPFATGIRVGFGVAPEPLRTVLWRVKGNHDFGTSHLTQQILRMALESGAYEKHVQSLRTRYAAKGKLLDDALNRHLAGRLEWTPPQGGLYIWAEAQRATSRKSRLFGSALADEVLYVPGELCYAEDPTRSVPQRFMRLSFGGAADGDMDEGVRRLARAFTKR